MFQETPIGKTHFCCNERIKKEGGKAKCCDCSPHEGCSHYEPKKVQITCLNIDCPERKSVCCNQKCTQRKNGQFACSFCGESFVGNKCTAEQKIKDWWKEGGWEEVFDMFYDDNQMGGSSRWKVSPDTVKTFIKGLLDRKNNEKRNL